MAGLSHLYKWRNWEWFMVLPTLLLGSPILGKPFDSYLRCLNAWAHPEPYFCWCPKATEDETPASISKFAFYDWLRSPIRCQLLGETCGMLWLGCHGSRWGVKYVIGKWNFKKREASRVFIGSNKIFFLIRLSNNWLVKKNVHTDFPGQLETQL